MAIGHWRKPTEKDYFDLRNALKWLISFESPRRIKIAQKNREKDPISLEGLYWTGKADGLDSLRDELIGIWNEHVLADKIEEND